MLNSEFTKKNKELVEFVSELLFCVHHLWTSWSLDTGTGELDEDILTLALLICLFLFFIHKLTCVNLKLLKHFPDKSNDEKYVYTVVNP